MSLKKAAASGVKWTAVSSAAAAGFQFLQLAVLSRILHPEDFGLLSMLMVVIGFARIYNDMGISNAIIYRQEISPGQLASLYWLNIMMGVVVYLAVAAASPFVVAFYKEPRLQIPILVGGLVFIISPLGQQFQVLFQKDLKFEVISVVEVGATATGVALSIVLALNGWGVFSIIWGQLCDTTLRAILFFWKGSRLWRPKFYFNWQELKGFLSFGFYQMGERSINYLTSNIDQILVGSLLGAASLGYYSLACNLVYQPFMRLNPILTKVAYPVFSKLQASKEKLAQGYLLLVWLLSFINFPLLFGIAGVATVLVPTVFGEKWLPVVEIIQILSLVGVLKSVMNPVGTLLLSRGRADLGFNWNIYTGAPLVAGVFLGIKLGGLFGVTIAILVLYSAFFVFGFVFLIKPQADMRFKKYLMTIVPNLMISIIMAVVVKYLPALFLSPSIPMLIVQVVLGLGIFVLLNYLFQREKMVEMRDMALNRG